MWRIKQLRRFEPIRGSLELKIAANSYCAAVEIFCKIIVLAVVKVEIFPGSKKFVWPLGESKVKVAFKNFEIIDIILDSHLPFQDDGFYWVRTQNDPDIAAFSEIIEASSPPCRVLD